MTRPSPAERTAERAAKSERTRRRTARAADRARLDAAARALRGEAPQGHPTVEDYRITALINQPSFVGATVSTARTPGKPRPKLRDRISDTYRDWVASQPCQFPRTEAHPLDPGHMSDHPHHEPPTGSRTQKDMCIASVCFVAHALCEVAPEHGGWTLEQKQAAAHRTWTKFWCLAAELHDKVLDELRGGL